MSLRFLTSHIHSATFFYCVSLTTRADTPGSTTAAGASAPRLALSPAAKTLAIMLTGMTLIAAVTVAAVCGKGNCNSGPAPLSSNSLGIFSRTPSSTLTPSNRPRPQVSGLVLDVNSGAPLPNMPVSNSIATAYTDGNGAFSMPYDTTQLMVVLIVNQCGVVNAVPVQCSVNASYNPNVATINTLPGVLAYSKTILLTRLASVGFSPTVGLNNAPLSSNVLITLPPVSNTSGGGDLSLRFGVVPPHAGPGSLQSQFPGSITNSTMLQSLFMVRGGAVFRQVLASLFMLSLCSC